MFSQHNFDPTKRSHQAGQPGILSSSEHNFDPRFNKDPKGVIEAYKIIDRIIDKNEEELKSSGTPMTLWKYYPFGPSCTCEKDATCSLCYGTGFLNGYQKYGYYTYTYASTSVGKQDRFGLNLSGNVDVIDIPQTTTTSFMLTSGTSGYIETNWIQIKSPSWNAIEHTFIKAKIFTPPETAITYSFTIDGINWVMITDLTQPIPVPPEAETIKIRLTLHRTSVYIPSPAINCFRYRFKTKPNYNLYDQRFKLADIPAFLASKQVNPMSYMLKQEGNQVDYLPKFWALPDVKIEAKDIGMFLQGNHKNQRFEFQKIELSEHGEDSRVLHTSWQSRFIFSPDDTLGIAYSLE